MSAIDNYPPFMTRDSCHTFHDSGMAVHFADKGRPAEPIHFTSLLAKWARSGLTLFDQEWPCPGFN